MADNRNFLLGKGERLTQPVVMPGRPVVRVPPYTFTQARARVAPMIREASATFENLPALACPHDETVGELLLNPEYIAKSYFPNNLLRAVGLRLVGSRSKQITPEQRSRDREPLKTLSTELLVAGTRTAFRSWANHIGSWSSTTPAADELAAVEAFSAPTTHEKIQPIDSKDREVLLEVVLHASEFANDSYILQGFQAYLKSENIKADFDRRFYAGGLCFLRLNAPKSKIADIAKFSFLRVAREMPRLRVLQPILRSAKTQVAVSLPSLDALDQSIKVAILDGGLPAKHQVGSWVKSQDAPNIGKALDDHMWHGHAVTSALLFGSLTPGTEAPRPYSNVSHFRILDKDSEADPFELYEVLERIKAVLSGNSFDFINLSVGPALPIDDNEVHAWTAVLDEHLSDGKTLAAIAVGNNGESDADLGYNRIQVPSDCVNGLSVGASDSTGNKWKRAAYSAIGPGRSPGIVKPDLLGFGGCQAEPYLVLAPGGAGSLSATSGTSFATPHVLRTALGLRAHFGQMLNPLAIKALLVHCADPSSHSQPEVGWGRVPDDLDALVTCKDGCVRIVYQGELTASKYIRAEIPTPATALKGNVEITATFCFATAVDSAHPGNYTRSGLEVFFRPNEDIREDGAMHAKTASFFRPGDLYPTEDELRRDAHKWENCLHASVRKRGSGLKRPVFDIHYNARAEGRTDRSLNKISYALVISIEAPSNKDIYDQVVRRYRTRLEVLNPVIQIPVRVG